MVQKTTKRRGRGEGSIGSPPGVGSYTNRVRSPGRFPHVADAGLGGTQVLLVFLCLAAVSAAAVLWAAARREEG